MLCNQSSRFYCDADEVEGLIRLLNEEERGREGVEASAVEGARIAVEILSTHQLRYPAEFMTVFRAMAFGEYESVKKEPTERESR